MNDARKRLAEIKARPRRTLPTTEELRRATDALAFTRESMVSEHEVIGYFEARLADLLDRADFPRLIDALTFALARHEPMPARYFGSDLNPDREYDCSGCGEGRAYPCADLAAIAMALTGAQ